MFWFRKKKEKDEEIVNLVDALREMEGHVWVGPLFMATYSPGLDKAILIFGDYRGLNEEQVNEILVEKFVELMAQNN
jgi:hypothetical protein